MATEDSKNGEREWQALLIISPQRLGFHENEEVRKRDSVGVIGISPVRLLPEILKTFREDWFSGGTVPLNLFQSSRR